MFLTMYNYGVMCCLKTFLILYATPAQRALTPYTRLAIAQTFNYISIGCCIFYYYVELDAKEAAAQDGHDFVVRLCHPPEARSCGTHTHTISSSIPQHCDSILKKLLAYIAHRYRLIRTSLS